MNYCTDSVMFDRYSAGLMTADLLIVDIDVPNTDLFTHEDYDEHPKSSLSF